MDKRGKTFVHNAQSKRASLVLLTRNSLLKALFIFGGAVVPVLYLFYKHANYYVKNSQKEISRFIEFLVLYPLVFPNHNLLACFL